LELERGHLVVNIMNFILTIELANYCYYSENIRKLVNNLQLFSSTCLRATSHARLKARDHHYTSSTLIGGKARASPSSLHTTLEGPTKYVNARWM
jgi:hypothetical protein